MWNPQPMRFRWIIFDADGTLFNYDRAEYYALRSTFLAFDYPFQDTYLQAYRHFNKLQWTAFEQGKLSLPTLKVRRFKCLLDELNIHTDPKAFSYAVGLDVGIPEAVWYTSAKTNIRTSRNI